MRSTGSTESLLRRLIQERVMDRHPPKPSKPGFEGFEGRDECHWCKIPGRRAACSRGNAGSHFSEGRAALGGGLEVERSNRAPCFALHFDEQFKVHRRVAGEHAGAQPLGRRGQFGGLAHSPAVAPTRPRDRRVRRERSRPEGRDAGATARDGCSRAARRPNRWSRGRPFSLATAGLLAADTWPTKAVLTRFMSAPVGAAYCAARWT